MLYYLKKGYIIKVEIVMATNHNSDNAWNRKANLYNIKNKVGWNRDETRPDKK